MIHLILGPDRYLVEREVARLLREYDPESKNTTRFDNAAALSEVANAVATGDLFGGGRATVAEGVLTRAGKGGKAKKADAEAINSLLAGVAAGNHLILVDSGIASVPASVKPPQEAVIFKRGAAPRGNELERWTQDEARRLGGEIERHAVQILLDRLFPKRWKAATAPAFDVPPELTKLAAALELLVLYASDRPVSADDVASMVAIEASDQMFSFADSVFAGRTEASLKHLVEEGLDEDSATKLLRYAGTQAELALVVAAIDQHENLAALGKELGIPEGRLGRLRNGASVSAASAVAFDVASADRRVKTGKVRGAQGQVFDLLMSRAQSGRGR